MTNVARHATASWWWTAAVIALVFSALLFAVTATPADADLWGHVLFGRDTLAAGAVPRLDPYSFLTSGQEWINHEWLAEVVFAWTWSYGGTIGLVGLKTAAVLLVALLLYRHFRRESLSPLAASLLLGVVMTLVLPGVRPIRPQLFTYLCFLLLLLALHRAGRRGPATLWLIAPVMAFWANSHGGFLAGVAVLGIWGGTRLAATVVEGRDHPRRVLLQAAAWALPLAVAVSATLLTPYGADLWVFLRTAFAPRHEIAEWNPIEIPTVSGLAYLGLITLTWTAVARDDRRLPPEVLLTLLFTSIAPLFAVRHAPLFALSCGVFGAGPMARLLPAQETQAGENGEPTGSARGLRFLAGLFAAAALALTVGSLRHFSCIEVDARFPRAAISRIAESGVRANLVVFFDWGEYAIWHLAPRVKVSMDGRRETIYSEEVYWEDHRFTFGNDDWDALLRKRPADLVLVIRTLPVYNLMKLRPGWSLVHEDRFSALYTRDSFQGAAAIQKATPASLPRQACFP